MITGYPYSNGNNPGHVSDEPPGYDRKDEPKTESGGSPVLKTAKRKKRPRIKRTPSNEEIFIRSLNEYHDESTKSK